ncbi:hypothetical protein [Sphingomonas sp. 3-13AW]|uniref:hypothetical protein n=1 Tax=Sphingomonas sp. 3-13AW TaxID=3050450 RepID=UPI003BB7E684
MDTDTFHDRTTWLAFRAAWRARYKELSAEIRGVRREIHEHRVQRRALGIAGESHTRSADYLQSGLWRRTDKANDMMIELSEAKMQKAEMLATREAVAA